MKIYFADLHLWKLSEDKKLVNKALGHNWKYGSAVWNIKNGNIIDIADVATGKVLVPKDGKPLNGNVVHMETKNKFQNQKWQFVKGSDMELAQSGWKKIKHKTSGYHLEISESGHELTVQGIIKKSLNYTTA